MIELKGKVAIVTGSSRGIGAACVKKLCSLGAKGIVNCSSSTTDADKVVGEIRDAGGDAHVVQANMMQANGVEKLFSETDRIYGGKVDILMNNAGFFPLGTIEEASEEDFQKVVNLNIKAAFLATKQALKRMGEGGRIINTGSIFGERMPLPGIGLYTMSKFAVAGFTRSWARDLGPRKITVNCIQPGPIDTDLNPAEGEFADKIIPYTAFERYGKPLEVASLVAFLASDEASYMTGACINVDGGANA